MNKPAICFLFSAVMLFIPGLILAQNPGYPQILIPTSEEHYEFPEGYETPWEQIEIFVPHCLSQIDQKW